MDWSSTAHNIHMMNKCSSAFNSSRCDVVHHCAFAVKSRQTQTSRANQLRLVPYEWSACYSPSSSPPLFEPVHQPCADPRPEKNSKCNQCVAPFMSSELFRGEGNNKRRCQGDCSTAELDHCGSWVEFSHQPGASQDYVSDFQTQLSPAVGESQNSQNAMLPAQSKCASWELGDVHLSVMR